MFSIVNISSVIFLPKKKIKWDEEFKVTHYVNLLGLDVNGFFLIYTLGRLSGYRCLLNAFVVEKGKNGSFLSYVWISPLPGAQMNASEEK